MTGYLSMGGETQPCGTQAFKHLTKCLALSVKCNRKKINQFPIKYEIEEGCCVCSKSPNMLFFDGIDAIKITSSPYTPMFVC